MPDADALRPDRRRRARPRGRAADDARRARQRPGGQHVNTTDSAVTISVAVDDLALDETQRAQLTQRLRSRISAAGLLAASSQDERSQHQNRRIARERLARMIGEALRPRTPRRPTRPGRAAVERRLDEKRQISARKRARRAPGDDA